MKKIIFETGWQSFFESHQLHGFDDFFHFDRGRLINQNSKRNVVVFELVQDGQARTFFMKRFIQPHYKDMLSAFIQFGKLCSQAEVEWRNARILLRHGIETYHPVCCGVRGRFGLERQSFFITEQIDGDCLTDHLSEHWAGLDTAGQQGLVVRLGLFFQKIHAAGIALPDSYIWHVYRIPTPAAPDGFELGMIDLHRMKLRCRGLRAAAKDLGAFLFSLPDGFMDDTLRSVFMDTYLRDGRIRSTAAFSESVHRWEQKIATRRPREVERI